jgi:hypothetical protein
MQSVLPLNELIAVLNAPNRADLCIGGTIDGNALSLYTGEANCLIIPLSFFTSSTDLVPDFSKFSVIDFGHAIKFGEYEASFNAVLSECKRGRWKE